MFNPMKRFLLFLRARWWWAHGRCPLYSRNPHALFAYYMAAYPNCPVCKDEDDVDGRMWHNYRALGADRQLIAIRVKD